MDSRLRHLRNEAQKENSPESIWKYALALEQALGLSIEQIPSRDLRIRYWADLNGVNNNVYFVDDADEVIKCWNCNGSGDMLSSDCGRCEGVGLLVTGRYFCNDHCYEAQGIDQTFSHVPYCLMHPDHIARRKKRDEKLIDQHLAKKGFKPRSAIKSSKDLIILDGD